MKIESTEMGYVLIFQSRKEMKGVTKQLKDQLEWVKEDNIESPYLYARYDSRIPQDDIKDMLDDIKERHINYKEEK